jgi:hypothetical protein
VVFDTCFTLLGTLIVAMGKTGCYLKDIAMEQSLDHFQAIEICQHSEAI